MSKHTISHANLIFAGDAWLPGAHGSTRGVPFFGVIAQDLGTPVVADPDRILDGETATDAAQVYTEFLAQPDVPRNLTVVGSAGADHVITVLGRDRWGQEMAEELTLNETTPVVGVKCFAEVTEVRVAAGAAGDTFDLGVGSALGLDYAVETGGLMAVRFGNAIDAATFVPGVTTEPATATTGDVRGKITTAGTMNGSTRVTAFYKVGSFQNMAPATRAEAYGVPQYVAD